MRAAGSGTPRSEKTCSRIPIAIGRSPAAPSSTPSRSSLTSRLQGTTIGTNAGSRAPPPRARSTGDGAVAARRWAASRARVWARAPSTRAAPITRNGAAGKPGTAARRSTNPPAACSASGHSEQLPRELVAERRVGLLARDPRHEDPGGRRQHERRDLRHEAVADREQAVATERVRRRHPVHHHADGEAAERVDGDDEERCDDVALHELHRAVHRAVELALALEQAPAPPRFVAVDGPAAQLRVDGHLLAGHRVEHETRSDLGDALRPLGDDDELDGRQDQEHDGADDVVAANDEGAEGLDDLARVGLEQDEPRRRHVERQAEERRQ